MSFKTLLKSNLFSPLTFGDLPSKFFVAISGFQTTCLILLSMSLNFDNTLPTKQTINQFTSFILGKDSINLKEPMSKDFFIMGSVIMAHIFIVSMAIYARISLGKREVLSNRFAKIWKILIFANFHIFSLPIFVSMISLIKTSLDDTSETKPAILSGAIVIILINCIHSLQYLIAVPLKTNNQLSRSGNLYCILQTIHRYLVPLLLVFNETDETISENFGWIVSILNFILVIGSLVGLLYLSPFFYETINSKIICLEGLNFSIALANLILLIAKRNVTLTIEINIIAALMIIPVTMKIISSIEAMICSGLLKANFKTPGNIIKPRFLLQVYEKGARKSLINNDDHVIGENNFSSILALSFVKNYNQTPENLIQEQIKTYLNTNINSYKSSEDKLTISLLYFLIGDKNKSYSIARSMINCPATNFTYKIGAYYIFSQIKESVRASLDSEIQQTNLMDYFQNNKIYGTLLYFIKKHLVSTKTFYLQLAEQIPSLNEIAKSSALIQSSDKKIEAIWNKIPNQILCISPQFIKLFAMFNIVTKTKHEKGISLLRKYNQMILNNKHPERALKGLLKVISAPTSIRIEISIDKKNLGEITEICTDSLFSQIGYTQRDLIHKNISRIYPTSLKEEMMHKIKGYIENSSEFSHVHKNYCLLLHKEGYIKPYFSFFMVHPAVEDEIRYLCVYVPDTKHEDILIMREGKLEAATQSIYEELKTKGHGLNCQLNLEESIACNYNYKLIQNGDKLINWKSYSLSESSPKHTTTPHSNTTGGSETSLDGCVTNAKIFQLRKKETHKSVVAKIDEDFESNLDEHTLNSKRVAKENLVPEPKKFCKLQTLETHGSKKSLQMSDSIKQIQNIIAADDQNQELDLQSISSVQSEYTQNKFNTTFNNLVQKLNIFKFYEQYYLTSSVWLLLLSIAISLFISFDNATYSSDQVDVTINLAKNMYGRSSALADIARTAYVDYFNKVYYPPGDPLATSKIRSNLNAAAARINTLNGYQTNAKRLLNEFKNEEIKKKFYEKNVRIYHQDFEMILNSSNFDYQNQFEAIDNIISHAWMYTRMAKMNNTQVIEESKYIMTLALNDLWIVSKNLPEQVLITLGEMLSDINMKTQTAYLISSLCLGIYFSAVIIVFIRHYLKSKEFLASLTTSDNEFACRTISSIEDFEQNMLGVDKTRSLLSINSGFKAKKEKQRYTRKVSDKILFINFFVKKAIFMIILILPSTVLLWITYSYPTETLDIISRDLSDMKLLNEIAIGVAELVSDSSMNDYVPTLYSQNKRPSTIYQEDIDRLDDFVSNLRGFSSTGEAYLSKSICPYYIPTPLVTAKCEDLANGQTTRGIKNLIYFVKDFFQSLKEYSDSIENPTMRAYIISGLPKKTENNFVTLNGIHPAIRAFTSDIAGELTQELDVRNKKSVQLFIVSIVMDLIVLVISYWWIARYVIRERFEVANTLNLVPIEFITYNKQLKSYLIKQSMDFLKLCKELEIRKKSKI